MDYSDDDTDNPSVVVRSMGSDETPDSEEYRQFAALVGDPEFMDRAVDVAGSLTDVLFANVQRSLAEFKPDVFKEEMDGPATQAYQEFVIMVMQQTLAAAISANADDVPEHLQDQYLRARCTTMAQNVYMQTRRMMRQAAEEHPTVQ